MAEIKCEKCGNYIDDFNKDSCPVCMGRTHAEEANQNNNIETKITSNVLTVGNILNNTFGIALKNAGSIILILLAYVLTIWIPYINVGTTIALWAFTIAIARNEKFAVEELFSAKYRKHMGEYFLLKIMSFLGTICGFMFLYIPGIILGIAWSQATFLLVDKNLGPIEALKTSNKITYGEKWSIFGGTFLIIICLYLIFGILMWIAASISGFGLVGLVVFLGWLTGIVCMLSCGGYIYNELSKKLN